MLSAAVPITLMLISVFSSVSTPFLRPGDGNNLSAAKVGQLVMASTFLTNSQETTQLYVVLIEVRDRNDVTVYLQFVAISIGPYDRVYLGLPWSPEREGEYLLRTFAFTSFDDFERITTISQRKVTITS